MNKNKILAQSEHIQTGIGSVQVEQAGGQGKPVPRVHVKLIPLEHEFDCESFDEFTEILHGSEPRFTFELRNGSPMDQELFAALNIIDEPTLAIWFEQIEGMDDSEKAALFYLIIECDRDLKYALDKVDEVCLHQGDHVEAAENLFDDLYAHQIPEFLRGHVDYKSIAHDMQIGGDIWEFRFGGKTYTCTNANQL